MRASSVASSIASFGRLGAAGLVILPVALGACKDDQLKGAQAEVQQHKIKVTMPTVPSFEVPKPNADGSHTVKEMRVQGKRYLKQEITIKGYVVWAYDCKTAIRLPDESDEAVMKRIETNTELCRRPAFYLGDTPDTPVERAVWVVEVPRLPTKTEIKNLPEEMLTKPEMVPPYKVGDEVLATGEWSLSSSHGESNTDGLLVYKSMNNITQNWVAPAPVEAGTIAPPAH